MGTERLKNVHPQAKAIPRVGTFALSNFRSCQSLKKSECERFALVTLFKRATVRESISSISFKKSNCEQIALYKRVTVSELLCISLKKRDVSDLLVCKFLTVANCSCRSFLKD